MEGGGGGLGSVVSVITSAASNWVSRHTAPLSVPSHRLHVLQRSLSLSLFSSSLSTPPLLPPLRSLARLRCTRLSPSRTSARRAFPHAPSRPSRLLAPLDALIGRNLPRDSRSGPMEVRPWIRGATRAEKSFPRRICAQLVVSLALASLRDAMICVLLDFARRGKRLSRFAVLRAFRAFPGDDFPRLQRRNNVGLWSALVTRDWSADRNERRA